ncbi:lytic transglycosylase [[Pantoea] beijingensis]|uniref:Lytic transglycosylase n=1 Tax=[Pantoea] beijingensis TaxID=1324864 RepID=A0A443IA48_9GAMM|nr:MULTISPECIES: lytic transglycosylase domain-containing protein [Erwiniaceae]RWR01002.1 lytic transglycosylase [[Pantoea] beijingensis]
MNRYWLALTLCLSASCQANCFNRAGEAFGIPPVLLLSIAIKESRLNLSAVNNANHNHTEDVCMMQVNSTHFAHLASLGISRSKLLSDPCTCVNTGAWVLHGMFRQYGKSWNTVGMYNAGASPSRQPQRDRYAGEVRRIYQRLLHNVSEDALLTLEQMPSRQESADVLAKK